MMNSLDLVRINATAPYTVEMGANISSYCFSTVYGVDYAIDFITDDLLESDESYQLIIANLNNKRSPRDVAVRDTIMSIVEEFFIMNVATVLYICETGDNRQQVRSRLFEYWFSEYKYQHLYTLLSSSVLDDEGTANFATIIIRNDNPRLVNVIHEFTESVHLLNTKP